MNSLVTIFIGIVIFIVGLVLGFLIADNVNQEKWIEYQEQVIKKLGEASAK